MRLLSLSLLFIALASGPGGDEQSALQRYKAASKAQEDALADLEKAYAHAEGALAAFRAAEAGKSPTAAERLASITAALVAQQQERPPPADAKEARARRRADLDELGRAIRSELSARGLVDDTLLDALGDLIAHEATAKPGKEDLATRCAQVLSPWLATGRGFELLWNDSLYARSEAAKSFKSKYDDYMAAGVELDRVRHPEFYLPGGAKTRPNMVYVPGGSYTVGPDNGFDRKKKNVTLRPFLLDRCEVSNADYVAFLDSLPAEQREAHTPRHWTAEGGTGPRRPPADKLDHPVVGVTWRDADAYAKYANKRLPTEDEWEVACRGKEGLEYPWGDKYEKGKCNDALAGLGTTAPVTAYEEGASPFKVLNMAGNVQEWTSSLEEGDTIVDLPSNIAPVIVRGGHFLSPGENVGGRFRWVAPGGSSRELYLGFRCAADLK
jgi:formylglycine-generating enzyme required for sulfatase activity